MADGAPLVVERGGDLHTRSLAVFDPTRTYRYLLRYQWDPSRAPVVWLMLNPSKAGAHVTDPTVVRCMARTRLLGGGGIAVLNLFAVIATDPKACRRHPDPVGASNDAFLAGHVRHHRLVIAGWGAHPWAVPRATEVTAALAARGVRLHCLATTRSGAPQHPLYLPYTAALTDYRIGAPA
jgi:hypothetical protein